MFEYVPKEYKKQAFEIKCLFTSYWKRYSCKLQITGKTVAGYRLPVAGAQITDHPIIVSILHKGPGNRKPVTGNKKSTPPCGRML
jgi:hypothetical protein